MTQTMDDMVGVRKLATREKLLPLLENNSTARRKTAENGAELTESLGSPIDESVVILEGEGESIVLSVWRMEAIGDIACSSRKENNGLGSFEKASL